MAAVPSELAPPAHGPQTGDLDVSLTIAWLALPTAHTSLFGGQAGVALPVFGRDWRLRLDTGATFGDAQDPLGNIAIGEATIGSAFLYSSPAEATVSIAVGPRVDVGIAWAQGNPANQAISSHVGSGFVSSLTLLGGLRYRLGRSWRAALDL